MSKNVFLSYYFDQKTPVYGGKNDVISFDQIKLIENGDTTNECVINLPNHSGTHIDFPRHFSKYGKTCSDYSTEFWLFHKVGFLSCSIEELPNKIKELPSDIEILILKTGFGIERGNEKYWQSQPVIPAYFGKVLRLSFPYLRVFGFDLISLTSKLDRCEGKKAHESFLIENDILILEDMNLTEISEKPKKIIISPLLIKDADGSPCTVIAFFDEF
jgi:arylformamidase